MLKKLVLIKLFARFDYEIEFKESGITILTGPNGYGKSTILKCIESLYEKNITYFFNLDFKEIKFIFEDESANISFEKLEDNQMKICDLLIPQIDKKKIDSKEMLYIDNQIHFFDYQDRIIAPRNLRNYVAHSLIEKDVSEEFSISDWADKLKSFPAYFFSMFDLTDKNVIKKIRNVVNQLDFSSKSLGQLYFIKEQRLIQRRVNEQDKPEVINVIENIPTMMKKHIGKISNNYSSTANRLDSTYPARLFNTTTGITSDEYKSKMNDMNEKFEKLDKYDISNLPSTQNVIFKDTHAIALKVYFDDFNEKYKVYEDFIQKLDLFTDIINNSLTFKEIRISTDDGVKVIDKGDEHVIDLINLSSGEKQEIVMFYDLIFETDQNAILLIDEPEISLHIIWQKKFMDDLLRVIEYKKMHAIVATHSPQIISNHWDLQIDLGELYGG